MCLPTGLTPVPIYDRVAAAVAAGEVSFARAEAFLLDEFGGVAASDPGRCEKMLHRLLIARIDLPPARFHRFDLAGDIDEVCRAYERTIGDGCDLTLLGVGTNGHVGMNEPGSPVDSPTRRVELAATTIQSSARYFAHTNLPEWGLTVGLKAILAAREVWLLANGAAKAAIIRQTLRGEISPANPASLLRRHENCSLFVDLDAGALLNQHT